MGGSTRGRMDGRFVDWRFVGFDGGFDGGFVLDAGGEYLRGGSGEPLTTRDIGLLHRIDLRVFLVVPRRVVAPVARGGIWAALRLLQQRLQH